MKKILNNNWFYVLVLLLLSVFVVWPLFKVGYFSHHDDLQVMRIFEMRRCFNDLQLPCRWVPDMGWGNGFPLFNFYNPFPYYLGAVISFVSGYVVAAKVLFFLPLVFAGIFAFILGKELFGRLPGLVVGVLYLFAPYRALDTYVRGAVAESFAIALIPLLLYFLLKLIKENKYLYVIGSSLVLAVVITSHNISTLFWLPLVFLWAGYWLIREKSKNIIPVVVSILLGMGLSAFFAIPSFMEKGLVQSNTLTSDALDFRNNFATFGQLFLKHNWGYGASVPGPNDGISFQIGWPHWWLVIVSFVLAGLALLKKKFADASLAILLGIVFLGSVFMAHNKSAFVWESFSMLKYLQFPWRFLGPAILMASILGGYVISNITKFNKILVLGIIILTVALNYSFFKPDKFFSEVNDQTKFSGTLWEDQQKGAILDYLPLTSHEPKDAAPSTPTVILGNAKFDSFVNRSNVWSFNVQVIKTAEIEVPVFYFPGWEVYVNGNKTQIKYDNYLGRIRLDLIGGEYKINGQFKDTPIRTVGNIISLISIIGLIFTYRFYGRNKNTSR